MVVGYSRWDNLEGDDSDSWDEESISSEEMERMASALSVTHEQQQKPAFPPTRLPKPKLGANTSSSSTSSKGYIHPKDDRSTLHPIFLTDPYKFIAEPKSSNGAFWHWGVLNDEEWFESMVIMLRRMQTQNLYKTKDCKFPSPEEQFVQVLMKRKEEALAEEAIKTDHLTKCDFVLKIRMRELLEYDVWRRVRVSGGMTLSTFQDKVLSPAMGWVRNYHGYLFMDQRDGAQFGPKKSDAIDMMHMYNNGWEYLDDEKYELCRLLAHPGDSMIYVYDLGDWWQHDIIVEEIFPESDSTGQCELLDGALACPPEDSRGNWRYEENILKKWASGTQSDRKALRKEWKGALNYKDKVFDPMHFDLAEAKKRLAVAIASKGSVRSGAKQFKIPLQPGANFMNPRNVGKGEERVHPPVGEDGCVHCGPVMSETIKIGRDRSALALCAKCGNLNDLKKCGGCRQVFYCSMDCQRDDWRGHKWECKKKMKK